MKKSKGLTLLENPIQKRKEDCLFRTEMLTEISKLIIDWHTCIDNLPLPKFFPLLFVTF